MPEIRDLALPIVADDDFGMTFTLPPSDPSWLNEEGHAPVAVAQVRDWANAFRDSLSTLKQVQSSGEAAEGVLQHRLGTTLRRFRGHSAWKHLGIETFEECCVQALGITDRYGRKLVFFAGITTEALARLGVRRCIAGFALARLLGAPGLSALAPPTNAKGEFDPKWKEPAAFAEKLGEPVDFVHSSAARIERLVTLLAARKALPETKPSRRVASQVTARQEVIEAMEAKHPALVALEVQSYAHKGKAIIKHKPASSDEELAAVHAMYGALLKI